MKKSKIKKIGGVFIFLAVFAIVSALIMLLWNAIIPSVVGWGVLSYWHAAGLLLLCRLLLGGLGKMNNGFMMGHHAKKHLHKRLTHMHKEMGEMSAEERSEYIRKRMEGFEDEFDCHCYGPFSNKKDNTNRQNND